MQNQAERISKARYRKQIVIKDQAKRGDTKKVVASLIDLEKKEKDPLVRKKSRYKSTSKKENRKKTPEKTYPITEIDGIPKLSEFDGLLWDAAVHISGSCEADIQDIFQKMRMKYFEVIHSQKDKIGVSEDKVLIWKKYIKTSIWNYARKLLREKITQKRWEDRCDEDIFDMDLTNQKSLNVFVTFDKIDENELTSLRSLYRNGQLLYVLREKVSLGHRLTKWLVVDCLQEITKKSKEMILSELVETTNFVNVLSTKSWNW